VQSIVCLHEISVLSFSIDILFMFLLGIIEELVKRHRQIDAVHFVQAFGLSEAFPPAPLLKTYVEELKDTIENNVDATATSLKVCLFYPFFVMMNLSSGMHSSSVH
jgi:hypothetical protein